MQARKIAYITALIAVELLAPGDANAGGTTEYIAQASQTAQMVSIPQTEYKQLVQDQVKLQMYETDDHGYTVSISQANEYIEEAYIYAAVLEDRLAEAGYRASVTPEDYARWKERTTPSEPEKVTEYVPEGLTLENRLSFCGGVSYGADGDVGALVLADFRLTRKYAVFAGAMYMGEPAGVIGFRFSPLMK